MPVQPLRAFTPQEERKEDDLDKVLKALTVAKGITGITSDFFNIKQAIADRDLKRDTLRQAQEKLARGEAIQEGRATPEQAQMAIQKQEVETVPGVTEGRGISQVLLKQPESELSQRQMGTGFVQEAVRSKEVGKQVRKEESDLRKEFTSQTNKIGTPVVQVAYDKVRKAAEKPSPAGDLALIFNYMKILDPGSTVREGEFANAENSGGVGDRVRNLYNKLLSGERLNPKMRADFVRSAQSAFEGQMELQNRINEQYSSLASEQGLDAKKVVREGLFKVLPEARKSGTKSLSAVEKMSTEELKRKIRELEK